MHGETVKLVSCNIQSPKCQFKYALSMIVKADRIIQSLVLFPHTAYKMKIK